MSFPRYPKYKPSGVEWLGQVPEHWAVCALKRIVTMQSGESITAESINETGDYQVFGGNGIRGYTSNYTHDGEHVLIGRQGALCGNVNYATGKFWASEHAVVVSPIKQVDTRWLGEMLRAMNLNQYSTSAAQPGLSVEFVARLEIAVPPLAEQMQIGAFLDRETAKIDELVAEQQRLIELLKEKRQAVISHAVTRGLNPRAPIKPSGVEWLGDVPAHWTVASVRRVVSRIEQGWSPECFARPAGPDEWGVVKSGCVNHGVFVEQDNKALPETLEPIAEYEIRSGDILMSRASGSPELVGSTALVREIRSKLMLSDKIFRIHLETTIRSEFFVAVFNSRLMRLQIERAISGAEGLANNLPQSALKGFFCAVPPIDEQEEIVRFLASATTNLDTLMVEVRCAIDLLQERRTALISAAVIGQIDVRELAIAEAA
jgi:type I restriction enzyme S subunit